MFEEEKDLIFSSDITTKRGKQDQLDVYISVMMIERQLYQLAITLNVL
jgi:hypothetical protein